MCLRKQNAAQLAAPGLLGRSGPNRTFDALHARRTDRRARLSPYSLLSSPAVSYPTSSEGSVDHGPPATQPNRQAPEPSGTQSAMSPTPSAEYWKDAGPTPTLSAMRTPRHSPPPPPPPPQTLSAEERAVRRQQARQFRKELSRACKESVLSGKPHPGILTGDDLPNVRKRSRVSLQTSTPSTPPSTETRIRMRNKRLRATLPDENELYPATSRVEKNPWALSSDDEGNADWLGGEVMDPAATSTPVIRPAAATNLASVPSDDDVFLDNANTSGQPPTPHCMQNSSFVARLRRSADDAKTQNRASTRSNADGRFPSAADRSPSYLGGSSPLPASSPPPSSSPIRRRTPITENDVQDLLTSNKMRLTSILSDPEGPDGSHGHASSLLHHALGGQTSVRTRDSMLADRDPLPSQQEQRRRVAGSGHTRDSGRPRDLRRPNWEERLRAASPGENSDFLPLPNTRAALHVQEQITARAAELARTRATSRPWTVGAEERRDAGRTRRPEEAQNTRSHSAMDLGTATPRSAATMADQSRYTPAPSWRELSMPTRDMEEAASQFAPSQCDPDPEGVLPLDEDEADATLPLAIPTILTAAAPEVDHPMPADLRVSHTVHRDDPEAIIRGISRRWAGAIWGDPPRTTVLLEAFNFAYTSSIQANRLMVETLQQAVYVIAGATAVSIVPPEVEVASTWRARDAPRVWAVRGLTPQQEEALLSRFPWSFRAISFFPYKRAVAPDTWLFALEGFFDENHDAIRLAVRAVLEEPEQWMQLVSLTRDHPDLRQLSDSDRANTILDSIVIKTWRLSNLNVVANVYVEPPTRDIPKWREWAGPLRTRTYGNFINGTGVVRRVSNCLGCNSVDHPAHRCPFHDLVGWNGPRAGTGTYTSLLPPPPPPQLQQQQHQNTPYPTGSQRTQRNSGQPRGRAPQRGNQAGRGAGPRTPGHWRQDSAMGPRR